MYNPYYCFHKIYVADQLCRKKIKKQMQISLIEKVHISYTSKNLVLNPLELQVPLAALTYITGQRSSVVWARHSVSSWKLRKNTVIGCKITLRRKFAFVFLEKLYVYGLLSTLPEKKKYKTPYVCFGISENKHFFELQNFNLKQSFFSGFYISIA